MTLISLTVVWRVLIEMGIFLTANTEPVLAVAFHTEPKELQKGEVAEEAAASAEGGGREEGGGGGRGGGGAQDEPFSKFFLHGEQLGGVVLRVVSHESRDLAQRVRHARRRDGGAAHAPKRWRGQEGRRGRERTRRVGGAFRGAAELGSLSP